MEKTKSIDLSIFPSIESLREIVRKMKDEKARWSAGSWIHKPDSWQNKAINTLEKEIQSREDFEALLRSLEFGDVLRKYGHEVSYGHIMMLENYRKEILGSFEPSEEDKKMIAELSGKPDVRIHRERKLK